MAVAVGQVEQDLDSLAYNFVTFLATDVGHESDSAGIVLLRGVVQTLSGRGASGSLASRVLQTRRHYRHVHSIGIVAAPESFVLELALRPPRATGLSRSSAQEHTHPQPSSYLQSEGKYNSEFGYHGCDFWGLAVSCEIQPNLTCILAASVIIPGIN